MQDVLALLYIPLPPVADQPFLHVVAAYKHLGSMVSANASPFLDACGRSSKAAAAYAPLSRKIFGSPQLPLQLRCSLGRSLVLSVLLYGVHL